MEFNSKNIFLDFFYTSSRSSAESCLFAEGFFQSSGETGMYLVSANPFRKAVDYATKGQIFELETLPPSVSNMTKELKKTNRLVHM